MKAQIRGGLLSCVIVVGGLLFVACPASAHSKKPNILFIMGMTLAGTTPAFTTGATWAIRLPTSTE